MGHRIKGSYAMVKGTSIGSLKFFFDSSHIIEKIFWLSMGILGTIGMSFVIMHQVQSWNLNSILSNSKWVELSEVDFPAITFCHQGNTRMAIADTLLQAADEKTSKIRQLRSIILKNTVEYLIKTRYSDSQTSKDISGFYHAYCSPSQCENCWCTYIDIGFGYAKDQNISVKEVYDEIYTDLIAENEISPGFINIGSKMANLSGRYNISETLTPKSIQWQYLDKISVLLGILPQKELKMPINLDRTLMEQLQTKGYLLNHKTQWKQQDIDQLYSFFILPDSELNLMAISHLYTMNDFSQLGRQDLFSFSNKLYLGGVPETFQSCFRELHDSHYGNDKKNAYESMEFIQQEPVPSPCLNITNEHPCQIYCDWHKTFFNGSIINRREFYTFMKYSQPQGKLMTGSLMSEAELNLTRKIFGAIKDKTLLVKKSPRISSMPLVIFCKEKIDQKWLGDDIGLSPKFCSDFYPTPTDQGVCQTKNLNYADLINFSEEFIESFDVNKDSMPAKVQGERLVAKATFVINTNKRHPITKTFSKSGFLTEHSDNPHKVETIERPMEMKEVLFQIHATNELPQILKDSSQGKQSESIILEAGNEYTIEVTPFGQYVTSEFKLMSYDQRKCLLSNEVPENSTLKAYIQQNCRYECKVRYAIDKCDCIPWDFPLKTNVTECDVFGRTCFMNAIKHFIANGRKCSECKDPCEFMQYEKSKITTKDMDMALFYNWNTLENEDTCVPKDICQYLLDTNDIIQPKTWYGQLMDDYIDRRSDEPKIKNAKILLADHIIVHVNFASAKVEMHVLDSRYSFYTKIANLGGTLGIAGQITGASILTMIHLLILIVKVFHHFLTSSRK